VQSAIADASSAIAAIDNSAGAHGLKAIVATQAQFLDKTPPSAPTATTPASVTDNGTPTVRVAFNATATDGSAAVTGDVIETAGGGLRVGLATLTADDVAAGFGNPLLSSAALPEGTPRGLRVTLTDQGGNASGPSSPLSITVGAGRTHGTQPDPGQRFRHQRHDGLTSSGLVTVNGLESGATWQYSTDDGTNWATGNGSSFYSSMAMAPRLCSSPDRCCGQYQRQFQRPGLHAGQHGPPGSATITQALDNVEPTTGNVATGGTTNDQTLDLTGTLSAALGDRRRSSFPMA
jgi:hypothetical protein